MSSPTPAKPDRVGPWLRAIGILCLFGAIGMAGYIGWVQWGTGFLTSRSQDRLRAEIEARIHSPSPGEARVSFSGDAIGILQIPKIDVDMVVVEGTSADDLKKGPGHYVNTAYPWQRSGRVGIAGHRTTYLHPFWNLDKLRSGDRIRLVTEYGSFDYSVAGSRVVLPSAVEVLRGGAEPTLVLTACTPRFSAARRLVVTAALISGPATVPSVRVQATGEEDGEVGPGDNVARPMTLTLAGSFAAGGLYLAVGSMVRRSRPTS